MLNEIQMFKRIRVVYNYDTGKKMCELWNRMTDGNFTFTKEGKTFKIFGEELSFENADFIIVVNGGTYPNPIFFHKTIFFKMEPVFVDYRWKLVGEWPLFDIYGTHGIEKLFLSKSSNALEWHLNKTRDQLLNQKEIIKTKENIISSIISGKKMSPGHLMRIKFALLAQNFFKWDAYGNCESEKLPWNNFLGSPEFKDEALFPYKYSFACENNFLEDYVTEKLIDCILAETLCFYDGAPNVENIIESKSFIKLDLSKPDIAIEIIKKTIKENEYEKRLPFIKAEKKRIIEKISLIPRLWKSIF